MTPKLALNRSAVLPTFVRRDDRVRVHEPTGLVARCRCRARSQSAVVAVLPPKADES